MIRQREMEEQMRRQREESYSRMGYMDPRERDMRMGGGGAMNMGDPYGSGGQKFPPLGGGGGIGYEANPGVPPATMSGSMMGSDMRTDRFGQGGAGPVGGQGPRGMGPGTPAGYGRGREEYEGPNKAPRRPAAPRALPPAAAAPPAAPARRPRRPRRGEDLRFRGV